MAALRAAGAEVVVLLSHLGLTHDVSLAGRVAGIDVIVGGHDPGLVEEAVEVPRPGGGITWVVEAGPYWFMLRDITYDAMTISGEMAWEDVLNQEFPGDTLTPATAPGLFQ